MLERIPVVIDGKLKSIAFNLKREQTGDLFNSTKYCEMFFKKVIEKGAIVINDKNKCH